MKYDLHSHSTASDGSLSPSELVRRAHDQGVDVLALTDHDTTNGFAEAKRTAQEVGLTLVAGVEVSVTWAKQTIHVLGLNVDPDYQPLQDKLAIIREERDDRALRMGEKLEKMGVKDAIARAREMSTGLIARTHYGRILVEDGYEQDLGKAIRKYLINGKPGFVAGNWISLEDAVGGINGAGGVAVIAHPARYRLSGTKMRLLIKQFMECGGQGIEVLSGSHSRDEVHHFADVSRKNGLLASCGSDFHGPGNPYVEIGRLPPMPKNLTPVWDHW